MRSHTWCRVLAPLLPFPALSRVQHARPYQDVDLLDAGCGPGWMVRELLDSRPGDFHITAMDSSLAMMQECASRVSEAESVALLVGGIEEMPLCDNSFDIVLAMGVLEYTEVPAALLEIHRVVRPDGRVLATMLNPASPLSIRRVARLLAIGSSSRQSRGLWANPRKGRGLRCPEFTHTERTLGQCRPLACARRTSPTTTSRHGFPPLDRLPPDWSARDARSRWSAR